jgi:hypothetical protein
VTDPEGDSLIAWTIEPAEAEPVLARWLSASGQLGPTLELFPGRQGFSPAAAMAPSGRAFVAWRSVESTESTVYGRWVEADGSLGPLLTLATPDPGKFSAVEVHVAVDSAGVATVSLRNDAGGNPFIVVRRIAPDSSVGPISEKIGSGGELEIADLPNGSTVVVWRAAGTHLNVVGPNLEVGTEQTISSDNTTAEPNLGVGAHGDGLVTWRDGLAEPFTIRGIRLDPTGAPVGGEIIIDPNAPAGLGTRMSIASDTAGNFVTTWVRYLKGESTLYARALDPGGEFRGPPEPVSAAGGRAEDLAGLMIDDRGSGAIVWSDYTNLTPTVLGRTIDSAGIPGGSIATLVGPKTGTVVGSSVPALGFGAFLTYQGENVLVRRFLEPPICRDSQAVVRQGRPIAVPLSCVGPGIETAGSVVAPGHGALAPFDPRTMTFGYTPQPGFDGTDRFAYTAGNDGGDSNPATVTIAVGKDTVKPRIKRFRFVNRKKRDRFALRVSEPARVVVTVVRRSRGAGKSRRVVAGRVRSRRPSIKVVIPIRGKLAKRLRAGGRFRATAVATDPARNRSKPKRLSLTTR